MKHEGFQAGLRVVVRCQVRSLRGLFQFANVVEALERILKSSLDTSPGDIGAYVVWMFHWVRLVSGSPNILGQFLSGLHHLTRWNDYTYSLFSVISN